MSTVFTVATGSPKYFGMAIKLARSFLFHNKSEIDFVIFTDKWRKLPSDLGSVKLDILPEAFMKPGLEFKVNFDRYAPGGKCLFIDADCFILRDLSGVFARFEGCAIGVAGVPIIDGEWCGAKIGEVLKATDFDEIARFNGGLYYVDMAHPSTIAIFQSARRWVSRYKELGFAKLGCQFNDEPLFSLALAEHSAQTMTIPDDGSIAADFNCAHGSRIDVLVEGATLINHPEGHPGRKWWYDTDVVSPAIVHYGSGGHNRYIYARESLKLYLVQAFGLPTNLAVRWVDPIVRKSYALWARAHATSL